MSDKFEKEGYNYKLKPKERVLILLKNNPGIAPTKLIHLSGVSPLHIYSLLDKLARDNIIEIQEQQRGKKRCQTIWMKKKEND